MFLTMVSTETEDEDILCLTATDVCHRIHKVFWAGMELEQDEHGRSLGAS